MRLRTILVGTAVLLLGGGAAGYHFYLQPPPPVKAAAATIAPIAEFIYATGTVEPIQLAKVVPLQRRRIIELCRCEGQTVTKGQVLGRQDDAEERAALKEMEIRYQQLLRDRERAHKDRDRGSTYKADYEQKDTAVKEAISRMGAQQSRLGTLVFQAPMDGMVLRRDGEVGEIAGPTDVLFWVGKPAPLQIVAEINEEEITKIAVGQTAYLSSEAFDRQQLRASVSHVTPKGDAVKKTFRVYLLLPDNSPLRIGMTVETNIVFRQRNSAVVVPADAVLADAVQVVSDGTIRRVPVSVGIRGTQYVEITRGVSAGMTVLSPARNDLADGARVRTDGAVAQVAIDTSKTGGGGGSDRAGPSSGDGEDDAVDRAISAAISAHVQSLASDARRNASRHQPSR